jgi:hypothetical protein
MPSIPEENKQCITFTMSAAKAKDKDNDKDKDQDQNQNQPTVTATDEDQPTVTATDEDQPTITATDEDQPTDEDQSTATDEDQPSDVDDRESDTYYDEEDLDVSTDYIISSLREKICHLKHDNDKIRKANKKLLDNYNNKYKEEPPRGIFSIIKHTIGLPNWTSVILSLVFVHTYKIFYKDSNSEIY